MPVDQAVEFIDKDDSAGVSFDEIYQRISSAGVGTAVIFVDACRTIVNIPNLRGFGTVDPPRGIFVGLSASLNERAFDGPPEKGSIFAQAIAEQAAIPGVPIEAAFLRVRDLVSAASGNEQNPVCFGGLTSPFYLSNTQPQTGDFLYLAADEAWRKRDFKSAVPILRKAADAGSQQAMATLGVAYVGGYGAVARDSVAAISWLEKSGLQRSFSYERTYWLAHAMSDKAKIRTFGLKLLANAADKGNTAAAFILAYELDRPRKHEVKNNADVIRYYDLAAQGGLLTSYINLGVIFERGRLEKNIEKAGSYYKTAADAGDPAGYRPLANVISTYGTGKRDKARDSEAAALLIKATAAGDYRAIIRLGELSALGIGMPRNSEIAIEYYRRALAILRKYAATAKLTDGTYKTSSAFYIDRRFAEARIQELLKRGLVMEPMRPAEDSNER